MKKLILFVLFIAWANIFLAAPFSFLPYKISQPNGETIECFVSGDEYFNWIHDENGFTIIQASDGYYYYADKVNNKLVPSSFRVNKINPESKGIKKWLKISTEEYQARVKRFEVPVALKLSGPNHAPHTGTLNNLVVYIRFSDETEIETTRQAYDDKLNPETGTSLKSYYREVSYNNLTINSTHYPACEFPLTTNFSYQDSHPRNYFKEYNETTNPDGYKDDTEARNREHQLLADAIAWINANHPVDPGLNIDADGDDRVDNVCFMIKGNAEGWSDLLWAHRWTLYSKNVYINSKRVYDYTFQPENQVVVRTLCHEMFHSLGAPDLYHYEEDYNYLKPAGRWDIMESGSGHMGAYMKWKYAGANWISSIPEITVSGTYTLNPLASATNNCYKIASPNSPNEFFVFEYRRKVAGTFENYVPGNGLLVYRINSDFKGNSGFNNISEFDEVYIYRPGGTTVENGSLDDAFFNSSTGRTAINDAGTNPKAFLTNGLPGGLDISNVSTAGATISFDVYISALQAPNNFTANGISESQVNLTWSLNDQNQQVMVVYTENGVIGAPVKGTSYNLGSQIPGGGTVIYSGTGTSFTHGSLKSGTNYYYRIWSKNASIEYSPGVSATGSTSCESLVTPFSQGFNGPEISTCWVVQTVAQGDVEDEPALISQVQSSTYPNAVPFEGSHMIKFNSTYCGKGNKMRLYSPAFSTEGHSQLYVNFAWHRDTQWPDWVDYMTIQWSTYGTVWQNGGTFNRYHTTTGWTKQAFLLPEAAMNQANLRIGFLFTSEYGFNCYLDNLSVKPESILAVNQIYKQKISIYPNPSSGKFRIVMEKPYQQLNAEVFDLSGKRVYTKTNIPEGQEIELGNVPKGVYLLSIEADREVYVQKIVVD